MPTPNNNPFEQIILPTDVPSAWPPAPVYWLILIVTIVVLLVITWLIKRHIKNTKIVKQALTELANLRSQKTASFSELNQLLKGLCLQYYPREAVASLSGEAWFDFIERHNATSNSPVFENKSVFCERLYAGNSQCVEKDFISARKWLESFPAQCKALKKSTINNQKLTGSKHV